MSHVTFFLSFFPDKVVELVSGGSVINGAYPSSFNLSVDFSQILTILGVLGYSVYCELPLLKGFCGPT